MKLFVDDVRNYHDNTDLLTVRTYDDCIFHIELFENILDFISLDYDLGSTKTGYDILVNMKENKIFPNHINIHSDHQDGVPEMKKYIKKNF